MCIIKYGITITKMKESEVVCDFLFVEDTRYSKQNAHNTSIRGHITHISHWDNSNICKITATQFDKMKATLLSLYQGIVHVIIHFVIL